jgi:DNA-binding transcriptional MerR regulator
VIASTLVTDGDGLSVDELARRTDVPVRTIREYQAIGLLPPPRRRGRVGVYGEHHAARLALIHRLQQRGYSLAGIRDLLGAWKDGADLGELLGLEPDQLVHVDEPGAPATIEQLSSLLPALVPARLDDLLATGCVEVCEPERFCIPSPSLLQLAIDALDAGFSPDRVLELLAVVGRAANTVADAVLATIGDHAGGDAEALTALALRGRGLLAHGVGRLTIHTLGRRLNVTDESAVANALHAFFERDRS